MTTTPKDTHITIEISKDGKDYSVEYVPSQICDGGSGVPAPTPKDTVRELFLSECPFWFKLPPQQCEWIVTFIRATEARVRREMLEKDIEGLEGMKKKIEKGTDELGRIKEPTILMNISQDIGYNAALTDIITQKKEALEALTKMV